MAIADIVYKILGIVNRVLWLIIGLVVLFAIIRVGTSGVEKVIGGTVGNSNSTTTVTNQQQQPTPGQNAPQPGSGQLQNQPAGGQQPNPAP